jgi:hypothetical protein
VTEVTSPFPLTASTPSTQWAMQYSDVRRNTNEKKCKGELLSTALIIFFTRGTCMRDKIVDHHAIFA